MSVFHSMMLAGAGGQGGGGGASYQIARSLRFNSADSAYLRRTPGVAGNRKTWTWAGWAKRSAIGSGTLFGAWNNGGLDLDYFRVFFNSDNIQISGQSNVYLRTTALFRDLSAWYHFVLAIDTTNATADNRIRLYVNGSEVTTFITRANPTQNTDFIINTTNAHNIGRSPEAAVYFNGYLADVHFIDGQALTPSSFGETDGNGVWQPKAYTGTYGTNGFHLDFADNSNTTAATLGKDTSGNGNNWTPNNFSVAAGSGNDSLVDSPTSYGTDTGIGGEVRGNYATLSAVDRYSTLIIDNGNLDVAGNEGAWRGVRSTFGVGTGKWYWEVTIVDGAGGNIEIGLGTISVALDTVSAMNYWLYASSSSSSTGRTGTFSTRANGNIIGFAFDADGGRLDVYKNGVKENGYWSGIPAGVYFPQVTCYGSYGGQTGKLTLNFGQRPFAYAAPSGFKALCTQNLPDEAIVTSGTFTGNAAADGPFIYLKGVPTTMTINGNAVTFGTHADKLANGFKVRTSSTSYNTSGSNTYSVTATGDKFRLARAQANP